MVTEFIFQLLIYQHKGIIQPHLKKYDVARHVFSWSLSNLEKSLLLYVFVFETAAGDDYFSTNSLFKLGCCNFLFCMSILIDAKYYFYRFQKKKKL